MRGSIQYTFSNGVVKTFRMSDVGIDGIDHKDAPDFVDAYISDVLFIDDTSATDEEVNELNDDSDLVHYIVEYKLY